VEKYEINESIGESIFVRCCCPLCAQIQEVNSVMIKEDLKYGCATLKRKSPPEPMIIERNTQQSRRTLSRTLSIDRAKK